MTADFESGVAKVVIPRTDTPNLEMLTLWDQAFIRRVDEPTWYNLPRGDFPFDFALGSARWVRTLDELVSPTIRPFTTIDEATETSVGTTPTRRLVVSADALPPPAGADRIRDGAGRRLSTAGTADAGGNHGATRTGGRRGPHDGGLGR